MEIPVALLVKIALIALGVLAVVVMIRFGVRTLRRTAHSAEAQVIKEIVNLVHEKGLDYEAEPDHPRLVSNMNKVYLPVIERDFPDFDWAEMRHTVEEAILKEYSETTGFEIDETVISRYERTNTRRVISCETAASYIENDDTKRVCIQSTLSYVNFKKLGEDGEEVPHALTCPRCGAPLSKAANGDIVCEFCGSIVVGEKQWQITEIKEK